MIWEPGLWIFNYYLNCSNGQLLIYNVGLLNILKGFHGESALKINRRVPLYVCWVSLQTCYVYLLALLSNVCWYCEARKMVAKPRPTVRAWMVKPSLFTAACRLQYRVLSIFKTWMVRLIFWMAAYRLQYRVTACMVKQSLFADACRL